jgi:hypothetical protein
LTRTTGVSEYSMTLRGRAPFAGQRGIDMIEITKCHMCGQGIIAARFCSDRCRVACDSGFPRHDPHYDRKVANSKLDGWLIVAGPPGVEVGSGKLPGRMGCEIVKVYKDHGISGAKGRDKRPAFHRLCRDATQRKFEVVMAWSVDRL